MRTVRTPASPQNLTDSRSFREIQFTPQRIVNRCLILKYTGIYHESKSHFHDKGTHYYYIFPTFAQFIKKRAMIQENFIKLYEHSFRENWIFPVTPIMEKTKSYTYGEVACEIAKLHLLFKYCSLRRGDKIAIIGKNNARWCIAYMAVITYGGIVVPILCRISTPMMYITSSIIPNRYSSSPVMPSGSIWKKNGLSDCAVCSLSPFVPA